MAQTQTVETVKVIRPLKVIALICACIAIILLIIAIASNEWLSADGYHQGLWEECFENDPNVEDGCRSNEEYEWIYACAALCIIGLVLVVTGAIFNALGLFNKNFKTKKRFYMVAMFFLFAADICVVIALIVFPAMFMQEIEDRGKPEWYFEWAYGVAWGAAIFIFGGAILLLIDKETDEVYYKEKYYESHA